MKQSKKIKSAAEIAWRQAREDERWEIRVEYLQEVFSSPSCSLPTGSVEFHLENRLDTAPTPLSTKAKAKAEVQDRHHGLSPSNFNAISVDLLTSWCQQIRLGATNYAVGLHRTDKAGEDMFSSEWKDPPLSRYNSATRLEDRIERTELTN